ncbi:hypothetical protein M5K25_021892 [Dendrobium thyrsiflorum]|uniref:Uncharacterized protein n=1 Tax=Dendrobium thyrsiflorum TaxID=117978 RepID=A0ABD0U559_DENTH
MVLLTSVARQRSFRPPSPTNYGPSDLCRLKTIFLTSITRRIWSLRPPLPTTFLLTSSFRPQLPDNGLSDLNLSDLCHPPTTVLTTSFADYGPSDLRHQTTVFPTSVSRRLRSLQPSFADYSPSDLRHQTMIFLTLITRQQRSFRPPSPADYGPTNQTNMSILILSVPIM